MSDVQVLPEIKQIVSAMLFAAQGSVTLKQLRRVFAQVADDRGGMYADYGKVTEAQLRAALDELRADLAARKLGLSVSEVANGFRMENEAVCGPWIRELLEKGKPSRLTPPALETLAIIAYRQPVTRAEIEGVRGVAVDQMVRTLMELQLIKIVGRSELPGRPFMLGTTQKFLEHFGLRDLKDLPGIDELRRMETERAARQEAALEPAPDSRPEDLPPEELAERGVVVPETETEAAAREAREAAATRTGEPDTDGTEPPPEQP